MIRAWLSRLALKWTAVGNGPIRKVRTVRPVLIPMEERFGPSSLAGTEGAAAVPLAAIALQRIDASEHSPATTDSGEPGESVVPTGASRSIVSSGANVGGLPESTYSSATLLVEDAGDSDAPVIRTLGTPFSDHWPAEHQNDPTASTDRIVSADGTADTADPQSTVNSAIPNDPKSGTAATATTVDPTSPLLPAAVEKLPEPAVGRDPQVSDDSFLPPDPETTKSGSAEPEDWIVPPDEPLPWIEPIDDYETELPDDPLPWIEPIDDYETELPDDPLPWIEPIDDEDQPNRWSPQPLENSLVDYPRFGPGSGPGLGQQPEFINEDDFQVQVDVADKVVPALRVRVEPSPKSEVLGSGERLGPVLRVSVAGPSDQDRLISVRVTTITGNTVVHFERTVTVPAGATGISVPSGLDAVGQTYEIAAARVSSGDGTSARSDLVFAAGRAEQCSEPALFEAYRELGSQSAFDALVARHQAGVMRTSYRILGNWVDAEDVTQLVFLTLARQQLKFNSTVNGWLQTVARNASIALLRSNARRTRHERSAARPDVEPVRDTSVELGDELAAALRSLPKPIREAVQLRYLHGMSQAEAAAVEEIPRGTLSQRASQGLRKLREILSTDQRMTG